MCIIHSKEKPFFNGFTLFLKIMCVYRHLSETEGTVWKDTARELSDVQWQQVLKGSPAKEWCPCWNNPSTQAHPSAARSELITAEFFLIKLMQYPVLPSNMKLDNEETSPLTDELSKWVKWTRGYRELSP